MSGNFRPESRAGGGGLTSVHQTTVTATGGSTPAADTTIAAISTSQTIQPIVSVSVDSDPAFIADYAWNVDWGLQWDDSAGEMDLALTVNWDTDPGNGNDVTLRVEVFEP